MNVKNTLTTMVGGLLLAFCSFTHAHNGHADKSDLNTRAPVNLDGYDLVLQIEQAVSSYPSGFPYKGAVVKRYTRDGKFTAQGTGTMQPGTPSAQQYFTGTFKYQRTGANTATEQGIDASVGNTAFTVKYTFTGATSGRWEEDFDQGKLKLSGSFNLMSSNLSSTHGLAPASITDHSVALIIQSTKSDLPVDVYPKAGLVVQTYAIDGSVVLKGFGPKTLDSTGTYKYTKIAPNTAVEEVMQVSPSFTLPYTMVYTFDTPTSGTWFQNLGDGLIMFHGVFNLFPSK